MPITDTEQKILSRLCYIAEYAPCNTTDFDYELEEMGLVKTNELLYEGKYHTDSQLTKAGINRISHLIEKRDLAGGYIK